MPLTVRNSARRRRKTPDEKLPERTGESTSSAQVMAPTRMKLRVRRRDNAAAAGAATGAGQPEEEEEERSRESVSRSSSRRKNANTSTTAAAASSSPPPSASASARAVMAAEEASPDSKCPICLDRFNNLAYLDRCLHRFCFPCIQEWSHNKAECPLCKQPFASILHSVRAEDDFKEYTLRPAPANSSVAATVAMVAAMASAARSDHQMRLMLRRHRGADGGETRRRRRERGGRGGGGRRSGVWEWYLDSPPLALPPLPHHPAISPVVAEDSEEGEDVEQQRMRGGADLAERGVIFEGLTGLGGAVAPVAPNDRASRRLMTRLVARQRLQREGGTVRRLRERETVAFRRALYRSGIRVRSVAGANSNQGQQQRDITAESFRRNPTHLNRLRPWLRRELTVLYGAHGSLVDIVQRIIMARLARHGLEDTPTIEEELRPFLLARTDHFLHELVSFARSPLSLENYDMQAVYEPPDAALELDGRSSSTDSSSVIAISEGEEEEEGRRAGGRSEERPLARAGGTQDDVIQAGSCLSLSAWDDETPGPSYSTAEPSCSLASPPFSPAPQEAANEGGGEKWEEEEEECLIVGYKKPIAERTPELVQLSSDTEEEEEEKKEENTEKLPPSTPLLSYLPTIPPSTSSAYSCEQGDGLKEKDGEVGERHSHVRSWSGSSGRSRNSVCTLSPATPGESERQRASWRDRKSGGDTAREKRRKKRRRRGRERSGDRLRKSGTLYNPNRSIYPAMMRHRSHSPSPFHSSNDSGSPLPPSPPDSGWEYHCSQVSPLTSSVSSPSRSSSTSSLCSSPQPSSPMAPMPSLSPSRNHHGEKPGGKRKYKSRHLDSDDKDPTWRPNKRRERGEREARRRGPDGGRKRERQKKDGGGESSSRRSREERSPSVEIIYEGTITSNMTQPPTRKRRRKRQHKTQHSSSPVIITLDSDSSHDDVNNKNSSSSSPLSSQQTVDFSDLPPLPLEHSAGVGGALTAEIGELPVDILDRGSDGSETERAEAAGPIAIDDNSDHDTEKVEESGSLLGLDGLAAAENQTGTRAVDGDNNAVPSRTKTDSEVLTSDSHLLASILSDLKGVAAPKPPLSFEPSKKCVREQREVRQAQSDQDDWLTDERQSVLYRNRSFDVPTCRTAIRPLPPLERLKECSVREEGKDVPPLLKQASPVRLYNRNTPPPLKHKDAGSPRLSPVSPVGLHSPHASVGAEPVGVNSHVDLNSDPIASRLGAEVPKDNQAIPPISTLKRHFTGALALRGELASTSSISSCHLAPIDSLSSATDFLSTGHKPPIDSHSSSGLANSSTGADCFLRLDFNSLHSSKLNSTKEISCSGSSSSPVDLHPVNSLPPIDFQSTKSVRSKEMPAHADSTSRGCRNKTLSPNSCRVAPVDLHPSSCVSEGTPAGGVFSGVNCNDTTPPVYVSTIDSLTHSPSSAIDSQSSSERGSERLSCSRVSSVPTTAPSNRLSPTGLHPRSPKSTVDLLSSSAASEGLADNQAMPLVSCGQRSPYCRLPPVDLHCQSPVPPTNVHSSSSVSAATDGHLNHTALSSTTFHTSRTPCSSEPKPTGELHLTDSHSKPCNHFDSSPPLPIDAHSKRRQRDSPLPADNHIRSSPPPAEHQWNLHSAIDAHSESQPPVDERSAT